MSAKKQRILHRAERRAAFFAEPRATRGTWEVRAIYVNDGGENRADCRKRAKTAVKAYRSSEWVVSLGEAVRAFARLRGPRGIVPSKVTAATTWTPDDWSNRQSPGRDLLLSLHTPSRRERAKAAAR
jgi:hypothetical protein